ncbi:TPM domain-containing protein [Flavimarina sp. Hel_I_48]|uniref:TPM domain-containing protein n=1 Tax=Flavimarina sp. Hel_I_48 TaxID=1392488 RepID=UPI0004DEEF4A|nr:TPM domain-containing protein [Flavimarina sp. Hel_I_48]
MEATVEDFLTKNEEEAVVEAIRQAELRTSGEIRVHLERKFKGDAFKRAKVLFQELKMDNTKAENGVLFYVAIEDRKFAICGDRGINEKVPANFWESTKELMQSHFKQGKFKQGLIDGITSAGEQLRTFFPWNTDDKNELSDEISVS